MATRPAQRSGRHNEYRDLDLVVRHGRARVGGAKDAKISRLLVVHAGHYHVRSDLPTVKLAYEWPQKFEHFGAYIKPDALAKYEQYLGNERRIEKGLEPRIEITGHLHSQNAKEYEVALDPVNADPDNPSMDRPHFLPLPVTDKIATIEKADVQRATMFLPTHSAYFASYFTITGLHGLHVLGGVIVFTYMWLPVSKKLYQRNPEHLANRVEVSGLFWHFVDLVWIFVFPLFYLL